MKILKSCIDDHTPATYTCHDWKSELVRELIEALDRGPDHHWTTGAYGCTGSRERAIICCSHDEIRIEVWDVADDGLIGTNRIIRAFRDDIASLYGWMSVARFMASEDLKDMRLRDDYQSRRAEREEIIRTSKEDYKNLIEKVGEMVKSCTREEGGEP